MKPLFLRCFLILVVSVVGLGLLRSQSALASDGGSFAVVVSAENPHTDSPERLLGLVRQLFLKERGEWPGGDESRPFSVESGDPLHTAFLGSVLNMSESELARHWISLKQRTGQTAPREVGSSRLLGKLVSKYPGAMGLMTVEDAAEAEGVRVLLTFN